jgi:hypothetical protein
MAGDAVKKTLERRTSGAASKLIRRKKDEIDEMSS